MRILVAGGTGFLGNQLVTTATAQGHDVSGTYFSGAGRDGWHQLDLCDRQAVDEVVASVRPDVIINTAFRQSDWRTTADGAAHVALAAARYGARLVQVSSDALFSGQDVHYDETAVPDPISPYGAAKAAAETAVRAIDPSAVIARTSLIIGPGSTTDELVRHLATGGDGVLFADDIRCAVAVDDLAAALLELAESDRSGIHHVGGAEAIDRYSLGRLIAQRLGLDPAKLRSGTRAGSGIRGPLDVRLDSTATQAVLKTRLRGASEFLSPAR
ncbi:sugar nucleotide-binding protein [Kribbella deserti]|uniref:dTDP-4-dehydrorhamnose reductase n=1 Tax=Kribbella deserti TaxID=1926257 RepID=A0ABV6QNY9_9ACTN